MYLYPLAQKLAVGQGLPRDSGYKPGNSEPNGLSTLDGLSGHSELQGPENPALYLENPGKAGENNHVLLFEWYLCLTKVCLGSLEH